MAIHAPTCRRWAIGVAIVLCLAACATTPNTDAASAPADERRVPWAPVKFIDFSPARDVLIRNDDGSLTPMNVPYYKSTLIAPGTWQIESDGDYHYLLEGDAEALAIDSGYGAGNLREYLQTLSRKPVRYIASTHDHFDHTANNAYFERAFMSAATANKATVPYPSFAGIDFPRDYPVTVIGDGYKFQLGNREVEAILIPNHTAGGTAYLDKRTRILFSGDEFMGQSMRLNVSVAQFAANMRKLAARRGDFDRMAGGPGIFDAGDVDRYLANAEHILAGHEGVAAGAQQPGQGAAPGAGPQSGLQPATPDDAGGKVVYLRRRVRAPDRPANLGQTNEFARRMVYADRIVNYDIRRVRD